MANKSFALAVAPGLDMHFTYNDANGNVSQLTVVNSSTTTYFSSGSLTNGFTWGVPTRVSVDPGVSRNISLNGQGVTLKPDADGDLALGGVNSYEIGM